MTRRSSQGVPLSHPIAKNSPRVVSRPTTTFANNQSSVNSNNLSHHIWKPSTKAPISLNDLIFNSNEIFVRNNEKFLPTRPPSKESRSKLPPGKRIIGQSHRSVSAMKSGVTRYPPLDEFGDRNMNQMRIHNFINGKIPNERVSDMIERAIKI